ncbi:MAG: MBL fold metallo-hydrolase [Actinomycetota bacterium]
MNTTTDEIADGIHRIATFVPEAAMSFNQILVVGEEPLLFHTGLQAMFPGVAAAVETILPLGDLRWISFGHFEADECGSMNEWLAAAPNAQVAFGELGCMVSVNDQADREPRPLANDEVLDIGGKRLRYLATPHVPHGWDAGLLYEETTSTLLCGDLFTQMGDGPATSDDSPMDASAAAEEAFGYSTLGPATVPTLQRLAELEPDTLALMHGPAHHGDGGTSLRDLADYYADRIASS